MRDSEARSMNNTSFVIREVPIQRMNRGSSQCDNNSRDISRFCKGKSFCSAETMMMMDYDTPELVVFLQEDSEVSSTKDKCVTQDCVESYEASSETTMSSVSNGSESMSGNHYDDDDVEDVSVTSEMCGFRNLMMMMMVVEGEKDDDATSQTLEEVEFSRSFSNWQIDSLTHKISNKKMEFPHCADHHYQQFPETSTSFRPEMENSQRKSLDDEEEDNHRPDSSFCTVPATTTEKSSSISHKSSDSISSSTHSFTFPILPSEWMGSPVRMAEADTTSHSRRRHRCCSIFFPCCKC